ncbi:MAG: hypothetical protein ACR2N3_15325 [Pyrinomonadaceae bacterium]
MSLINCPECGNECSASATICPNCGHPFVKQVVQPPPRVVVKEVEREDSFPKWIFIPLALLGVIILFVVFIMLQKNDNADQRNINVNIATARTPSTTTKTSTTVVEPTPNQIVVPPTSQPQTITTVPPTTTTSTTTVAEPTPTDKAIVDVEAKIMNQSGSAVPVAKEKFYLLDKDLESILADAGIQDETGQGLTNAFGMSVVNPTKYRDTNQKALAAIKPHIVYSTLTDATGKAELKDVKPKSYYLFGVHKTPNGFAVWSSPVTVNAGQNSLVIPPVSPTEIVDSNY